MTVDTRYREIIGATEEQVLAVLENSDMPLEAGAIARELGKRQGTGVGRLLRRLERDGRAVQVASYAPWQWVAGDSMARATLQAFRVLRNFYDNIKEEGAQEMSLWLDLDEQRYRRSGMVAELKKE